VILVVAELADGAATQVSREAWAFAAGFDDELLPVRFEANDPVASAVSLVAAIERTGAAHVVAAGTDHGNEVLAHAGALARLPFVAECVAVVALEPLVLSRQRWGGSLLEEVELDGPALLGVTPHALAPVSEIGAEPEILAAEDAGGVRPVRVEPVGASGVSLTDARVVVGGGRGVGSAEGFAPLEELAAALDGAIGVSRAVTSAGWRPHHEQIGQTGARIAPDLYVACGISGASQHLVGCAGARHVLAINTDPDAPIVARAAHAVIGDLHAVVPAITEELRRRARDRSDRSD
jgi:electron transfer flavoprotein alpha subunit